MIGPAGGAGEDLREAEEVALDRGGVGRLAPEVEQVGDRVEGLAALAEGLADLGVLEVAGLDDRPEDEVGPLVLADVAVGPADDQDLVEGDDQLGALLLRISKSWTTFRGW